MWLRKCVASIFILAALCSPLWAARLVWDASIVDATHGVPAGYKVSYGSVSGAYTNTVDVGLAFEWLLPDAWPAGTYYFSVSAYNAKGPSGYSNEAVWVKAAIVPPSAATNVKILFQESSGMTTYFGECNSDGSLLGAPAGYDYGGPAYVSNINRTYTCPGTGSVAVESLGVYCKKVAYEGQIRLAVYDSSWNLVFQWANYVQVTDTALHWQEALASLSELSGTLTLTGGSTYHFVATEGSDEPQVAYNTVSAGDYKWVSGTDYLSGYPASLSAPGQGDTAGAWVIRVGTTSAAAATIEQEGFRFRNDDGSESAATWKDSQDTNINLASDTAARIRMLLNATGDPASIGAQLEYRYKPSGGAFGSWKKILPLQ